MEKIAQALERARRESEHREDAATAPEWTDSRAASKATTIKQPAYQATRVVPVDANTLKERRVVATLPSSDMADAFRVMRTRVVQQLQSVGGKTLAITSPRMGEGKTVIAANLAISLSQFAQHTVLLVDLDLRRPGVHEAFGVERDPGLTDYLLGGAPLTRCLVNPGIDRLVLLPSGAPLIASSETLSTDSMTALAVELKNRYANRLVLYDLPPLLPTDDALVFLRHVDATLLVVAEGKTRRPDIERSAELLKDYHVIGTVLNKAQSAKENYGYT